MFLRPTHYFYNNILHFHNDPSVESLPTTNSSGGRSWNCVQIIKFGETECKSGINMLKYLRRGLGPKNPEKKRVNNQSQRLTLIEYSIPGQNILLKLTKYFKEYSELDSKKDRVEFGLPNTNWVLRFSRLGLRAWVCWLLQKLVEKYRAPMRSKSPPLFTKLISKWS